MFVGHYSAAFVAAASEPRVPLWVALVAAQFVDVFWAVFVLAGVEHVRLDPALPSNSLVLYDMPYTHSLVATALWASVAGLIAARVSRLGGTGRAGLVVGLVVLSHWLLDLLVHRPDLTLWGAPPKLGLGLWNAPLPAYLLELAVVAGSAAFYAAHCKLSPRARTGLAALVVLLAALQTFAAFGPVPGSVPRTVLSMLAVFAGVAYAGFRAERFAMRETA